MLCRMLSYSKNHHAEIVVKELSSVEPAFLAIFGLEELLDVEAACNYVLAIIKVYLDKKSVDTNAEVLLSQIISKDPIKKKFVQDFYYQNQPQ